jgi:bile acid-coenzyme A ligase
VEEAEVSYPRRARQLAAALPDEPAYRHIGADGAEPVLTWPEIDRRSAQLAGALAARGLGVGDRLGLALRNSPQFLLATLAAWKVGAVPVPVRWDVPDWELARLLEVVGPRVHLGPEDAGWIDGTATAEVPDLPDVTSPMMMGICSSGATGTPKVILRRQRAVHDPRIAPMVDMWAPVPRPQTILVPAPMYHTNGFTTLMNLFAGDRLVVMERFDAARVVDVIERHRVSTFTATPTMLKRIAEVPGVEGRDLSSIEWFTQGAAPMPPSLVDRWAALVGAEKIVMAYGSTEGIGLTALRGDEWMGHRGSVGRGIRGTEVRIVGAGGEALGPGEVGEIYLRSPMQGGFEYLGTTAALSATADGFQSVGDMGWLDGDGYLYVADRRVDLILSGGANVYPAEVELALIEHPDVGDVVVIGLRDEEWGRRVHALVAPRDPDRPPTADGIRAFAKDRLAAYKVPKTVELVDAIPRSEATKVNRRRLVEARGG